MYLAYYIFNYQIKKDQKLELRTAQLNEQNIKLQWFKELVIQPNKESIDNFYKNLLTIQDKINSNDLSDERKEFINNFAKEQLSNIRKDFVDVLLNIDSSFAKLVLENLDELIDDITNAIFNDELKLKNSTTYNKFIGSKILYSRNKLISQIYNYKGIVI